MVQGRFTIQHCKSHDSVAHAHAGLLQLSSLARLRSLVLWNCMRVTTDGLEVFRRLPALADLSLRGCSQLPDALCFPVAHLAALTRLDLRACERFTGEPLLPMPTYTRQGPVHAGCTELSWWKPFMHAWHL